MFFVETDFGKIHQAAVLNVIPPQKAGLIAERAVAGAYQVADGKTVEVARDTWGSGA